MRQEHESCGLRLVRLETCLLEELRALLRDDVTDPALTSVWIQALVLSVDYRHARVHYVLRENEVEARRRRAHVEAAFVRVAPFLRAMLAHAIDLKRVPDLRFVFDGASGNSVSEDDS